MARKQCVPTSKSSLEGQGPDAHCVSTVGIPISYALMVCFKRRSPRSSIIVQVWPPVRCSLALVLLPIYCKKVIRHPVLPGVFTFLWPDPHTSLTLSLLGVATLALHTFSPPLHLSDFALFTYWGMANHSKICWPKTICIHLAQDSAIWRFWLGWGGGLLFSADPIDDSARGWLVSNGLSWDSSSFEEIPSTGWAWASSWQLAMLQDSVH